MRFVLPTLLFCALVTAHPSDDPGQWTGGKVKGKGMYGYGGGDYANGNKIYDGGCKKEGDESGYCDTSASGGLLGLDVIGQTTGSGLHLCAKHSDKLYHNYDCDSHVYHYHFNLLCHVHGYRHEYYHQHEHFVNHQYCNHHEYYHQHEHFVDHKHFYLYNYRYYLRICMLLLRQIKRV
ncbi:hypothetical protein N7504_004701 [Penicillium tannophilum]|nr:hypothetical protein N7504_004701 [Penicillium tannophilum]